MEAMKVILSIVERGQGAAMQRLYRQRHLPIHLQCAGRGTATLRASNFILREVLPIWVTSP